MRRYSSRSFSVLISNGANRSVSEQSFGFIGRPSVLRVTSAGVIRESDPHRRFKIELILQRA